MVVMVVVRERDLQDINLLWFSERPKRYKTFVVVVRRTLKTPVFYAVERSSSHQTAVMMRKTYKTPTCSGGVSGERDVQNTSLLW